jgi:asparagine synthetase B (glutamine-hydrolysing)
VSGFVVSRSPDADTSFVARRGPDLARTLEVEGYFFRHYLADVGGRRGPQPFVDGDVVAIFDGEIYSHPEAGGDAGVLTGLYRRHGEDLFRQLDGEYALAVYDFGRGIALLGTDAFGTKPLFAKGAEAASYRSGLGAGERLAPNTVTVVELASGRSRSRVVEPFDFDHQHKETYDDWIAAFERAVERRAADGCYLPLSAGYDSGAVDCALRVLGAEYRPFSIAGLENVDLLAKRNGGEILRMTPETFAERLAFLRAHAEPATYRATNFLGERRCTDLLDDRATCGLALLHSLARADGRRVFLSGQGVDEIIAACRHWPGARFPERLEPWPDFCGNWQVAYLTKEELVAGAFGAEGRYPYLDRAVVQEFLWLSPELKNRRYKAPLHEYMTRHGYPFDENVKTGFNPLRAPR